MTQPLLKGKTIRGYELGHVAGVGGFGMVYKAHQPVIDREVAVKVIHGRFVNQLDFMRRFELEARLIGRLESMHIVPLYDYWRDPSGAYLVMRWMRGGNLRGLIDTGSPLPLQTVARLLFQIAAALETAHRHGVIHRDIKPENILLDEAQNAYLTDFGIAVDVTNLSDAVMRDSLSFGSPAYMAPEQLLRQRTTPQGDVYSLGILLYEMLTGRNPFPNDTTQALIIKQAMNPMLSVNALRPDLPRLMDTVIWQATALSPEARYRGPMQVFQSFAEISNIKDMPWRLEQGKDSTPARPVHSTQRSTTRLLAPQPTDPLGTLNIDPQDQDTAVLPTRKLEPVPPDQRDHTLELTNSLPRNPYKGLRAFDEADAGDFFGRNSAVARLTRYFEENTNRFLVVVGPSGSGKSSLVRAGLLASARHGLLQGSESWLVSAMTPGANPYQALGEAMLQVSTVEMPDLESQLRADPGQLHDRLGRILPAGVDLFLLIDQFEELFTLDAAQAGPGHFLDMLHHAVTHPESRLRLVLTLRADYYDRPLQHKAFGELMREHSEVVLPLSAQELEEAIIGPALRVGLQIEPALKTAILDAVIAQPGTLPLLQYTLSELYAQREGHHLTQQAYERLGGVSGALSQGADEIYNTLTLSQRRIAQQVFLQLITLERDGEGGSRATRKRALLSSLFESIAAPREAVYGVIEQFSKARLLTLDHDPLTRYPTVEIAHESLITAWDQLRGWIDEDRSNLHRRQQLQAMTQAWADADRDPSFLVTGTRLAELEPLLHVAHLPLSPDERAFLDSGLRLEQRRARRTRWVIAALTVFSAVTLALAVLALDQQRQAVAERDRANTTARIARSRELAATALSLQAEPDTALLIANHALASANTFEARNSLLSLLQSLPYLFTYAHGHHGVVRTVETSPIGTLAASSGEDRRIVLWDTVTWDVRTVIEDAHQDTVNTLAFAGDGETLYSAGLDGQVHRWDLSGDTPIGETFATHSVPIWSLAVHPEGGIVAAGDGQGGLSLWDTASGERIVDDADAHDDAIYALAYAPDGSVLVSGSADFTVQFRDSATGEPLAAPAAAHENWVLALDFSSSGRQLASTGADGRVVVWDVAAREVSRSFSTGHTAYVRDLAYNDTGELLATVSLDGTLRVWSAIDGSMIGDPQRVHQDGLWTVAAAGGLRYVTGSADTDLIVWDFSPPGRLSNGVLFASQEVLDMAAFPAGDRLAAVGSNGVLQIWDTASGEQVQTLASDGTAVLALALSADGTRVAGLDVASSVVVWDVETASIVHRIVPPDASAIADVIFTADGHLLTGTNDGSIHLWDLSGDTAHAEPLITEALPDGAIVLAQSPDAATLAAGSASGDIALIDLSDPETPLRILDGHTSTVTALAFTPDGETLVSGGRDGQLIVWDYRSGRRLFEPLQGHRDWVLSLAISPDGRTMASGSRDQSVILWDLETAQPIGRPFTAHSGWVSALAFTASGDRLYSGARDGVLIAWAVTPESWRDLACRISHRDLLAEEWQRYFDTEPAAVCG